MYNARIPESDMPSRIGLAFNRSVQNIPTRESVDAEDDLGIPFHQTAEAVEISKKLQQLGLLMEFGVDNNIIIEFPRSAQRKMAVGMFICFLLSCVAIAVMFNIEDIPLHLPIASSLFLIFFPALSLHFLLAKNVIDLSNTRVRLQGGLFGIGSVRQIPTGDIEGIYIDMNNDSESKDTYHTIHFDTTSYGRIKIAGWLDYPSAKSLIEIIHTIINTFYTKSVVDVPNMEPGPIEVGEKLRHAGLQIKPASGSGITIVFPAFHQPKLAIGLLSTLLIILGTIVVLVISTGKIFVAANGLLFLLVLPFLIQLWTEKSRVEITRTGMFVERGIFGKGRKYRIAFVDIENIDLERTIRIGNKECYTVYLKIKEGKKVDVAKLLEKHEAHAAIKALITAINDYRR